MSRDQKEKELQLQKFVQEVEKLHPTNTSAFIFKVPDELKNGHGQFFEPKTISIGPLHAKKPNLSVANEMKKWYLKSFLSRLEKAENSKDELIKLLIGLEPSVRDCYKDVDFETISDQEFLEIMLLDGCFIVELFLRHNWKQVSQEIVYGKEEKVPLHTLQQDLLKLENQLPFFVLNYLSQLCQPSNAANDRILVDAALNFFQIPVKLEKTPQRPRHLLELVMFSLFHYSPQSSQTTNIPGPEVVVPQSSLSKSKSASELELYGIKFKPRYGTNSTDIKFSHKGILSIPPLEIQESTESLFWNFLIFEMCSSDERIFASYVLMIDTLVDNENDVDLLLRSGVIKTRINDKKRLVSLYNDLSVNLPQKDFYFDNLLHQVNKYCESDTRPIRAYFVRNYYDARWDALNSVLLFILTVTQTLFSILAYNPKQK